MIWLWLGFLAFILVGLVVDLVILDGGSGTMPPAKALRWVGLFVVLALCFNVAVYFIYENNWLGVGTAFVKHEREFDAAQLVQARKLKPEEAAAWQPIPGSSSHDALTHPGRTAAAMFLSGWLTEYALSIDNLFVIALIFTHFKVPGEQQRRVLFWGILGALVFRGVMIATGTQLVQHFTWSLYFFGALLIYLAIKLLFSGEQSEDDLERSAIVRWARRFIPLTPRYDGRHFVTRVSNEEAASLNLRPSKSSAGLTGRLVATPLLLVLVIVECTDVVFAVDSIPAILGITRDPFLVFTSNVFAILGLRSLYFALAGLMDRFHYLKYSLSVILGFVGIKMLLEMPWIHIEISAVQSLAVILSALALGVGASLLRPRTNHPPASS